MEKQISESVNRGIRTRIGRTTYEVTLHGNEKSKENVENKLKRIILSDRKALKTLTSDGNV